MNVNNNTKNYISNSVKTKKIKNFKFYDIDNASTTFQKIITKYRTKKKKLEKQPKNLMAFIERARFKAENLETENEYMIKELKKDIKAEKELVDLFGSRANKHYNDINNKKFQSKINKYDFFTPKEIKEIKENKNNNKNINNKTGSLQELTHIIFKGRKINFSPAMLSKNRTYFLNTYNNELKNNNMSTNTTKFKSFYNISNKIKKDNNFKPYNTFDGKDNYIKIIENNKTYQNNLKKDKKNSNNMTQTDNLRDKKDNISNRNLSMNITRYRNKANNEFNLSQMAYLDTLVKINNQFLKKEKLLQEHFKNNDYGCGISKMEYRYLTKKYFK